ncbi:vacuolar protein sorting-associated protein 13B [Aplysia californica]|uniref:Vacuolar protein sorting-associated protein 13B n=1 Tax=Aplysia californica TaxID=6500 RepID=A0ABM1W1K0_APLCA|nr:vacuolar protein sorting-associated protein 13B [Aplysia californica]
MFKLESYITPLIMGYVDKYVKLRQEDFQLSLWGGDAVLNNLDLRLDELEKIIQLPVMFQSGHIHELRLHVPWTKLGSEPVVITINTVECVLKVRDTAYDVSSTTQSSSTPGKTVQHKQKAKRRSQSAEELPPGYLQSIVGRIINNVTFVINNLILKFVEDDIVLSVNVKSAECYSVDRGWNRAFVDLTPDDLALRKVLNFADLTVCLDKSNASGHIESYQEPLAYRCALTCRLIMEYETTTAKFPRVTRFNLFCETLSLSLSDTQLPLFVRLVELCIAMYYGALDIPSSSTASHTEEASDQVAIDVGESQNDDPDADTDMFDNPDQGWASWAWSYVPQILPEDSEDVDGGGGEDGARLRGKPAAHILSIGFYIHHGTILFKLSEKARESSELPHRKIQFHPFLRLSMEGLGLEVVWQGLNFFDVQCGITSLCLTSCGNCICGAPKDGERKSNILLSGGEPLDNKVGLTYISNSLFDDLSWENRGQRSQHIVDGEEHRQVYSEQSANQRFGAFWVDSLYTYEKPEKRGAGSNSSETDNSDSIFQREFSTLRFLFGNTRLNFSSSLYHRAMKFWHCALDHQYLPYGGGVSAHSPSSEDRPKPTEEQVQSLEDFIPTRLLHLTFLNPTVMVLGAEHPPCDVARRNYKSRHKKRGETKASEEPRPPTALPALLLSSSRFDLQVTRPMYPGRLVKLVTAIAGPSSNLLHHCHSHTQIKLFSLQIGLQRINGEGVGSRPLTVMPPCSFALYLRSLLLPKLWTNSSLPLTEWMYEIPSASVTVNKASVMLGCRVLSSWLAPKEAVVGVAGGVAGGVVGGVANDSLLDDLFPSSGECANQYYPLLELGLFGLELKSCESSLVNAWSANLSAVHILLYMPGVGGKMSVSPILYGPCDTSQVSEADFLCRPQLSRKDVRSDCVTVTLQVPKHTSVAEAQALTLVDIQGMCAWFDPGLTAWFHYVPLPRPGKHQAPPVTLDLSLAQMTSPLNAMSQASVHSTSSPSQPAASRHQTSSQPVKGVSGQSVGQSVGQEDKPGDRDGKRRTGVEEEKDGFGRLVAQYFPLIRLLHLQFELQPCAIFLPKTSVPHAESSPDVLSMVHQARQAGRLSDTLVVCLPGVAITSAICRPINVAQELPVTSIQGSLIGEKLPWTVKVSGACVYSLLSGQPRPAVLLHPLDVLSTLAVSCKYSPPTSEVISTLALCLHVDVGQPVMEVSSAQLHLCSTVAGTVSAVVNNSHTLLTACCKLFAQEVHRKPRVSPRGPPSQRRSVASTNKIESIRSADVTENVTTDVSEDLSHDASPLHESIFEDEEDAGVKLSLWLQLMVPSVQCSVYHVCPGTQRESGVRLTLDHVDLSLDSQTVYSKAKLTLGAVGLQHSQRREDGGWTWSSADGAVVSSSRRFPRHLLVASNKPWLGDNTPVSFAPAHDASAKEKKHGVLSVTFTRALCKNVKKRLRRSNVELPSVDETGPLEGESDGKSGRAGEDLYFHEYLSEICVKTEPFDFVLKSEVMDVVLGLTKGAGQRGEKVGRSDGQHAGIAPAAKPRGQAQGSLDQGQAWLESMSVHNWPLLYADVGLVRIFVPTRSSDETSSSPQIGKSGLNLNSKNKRSPDSTGEDLSVSTAEVAGVSSQASMSATDTAPAQQMTDGATSPSVAPHRGATQQEVSAGSGSGERESHGEPSESPGEPVESHVGSSTLLHDMLVLQVNSCTLQPHADNPLPRSAQEKEVYVRAVQSGLTHQPGAVIEDRQYQMDVKGLSVSTGVWQQVLQDVRSGELHRSPTGSTYQIPALDWNTFLMDSMTQERKEIRLVPIATAFDLCLVLAPPISYVAQPDTSLDPLTKPQSKLVCGFTTELNLTSDLDLYLSTSQVKLLSQAVSQFVPSGGHHTATGPPANRPTPTSNSSGDLSATTSYFNPVGGGGVRPEMKGQVGVGLTGGREFPTPPLTGGVDSGVESEVSVRTTDRQRTHGGAAMDRQRSHGGAMMDRQRSHGGAPRWERGGAGFAVCAGGKEGLTSAVDDGATGDGWAGLPPLDVLLTAGRISCTVYTHKILSETITQEMPLFRECGKYRRPSAQSEGGGHTRVAPMSDNLGAVLSVTPPQGSGSRRGGREADEEGGGTEEEEEEGSDPSEEPFTTFNFMKQVAEESLKRVIPPGVACVVPFVYLYVTQPHCLLANHSSEQLKMEVSCYDLLVKGASERHVTAVDELRVMPDCADFNVHWLETRAGQAHPYTGIPPSLFTLRYLREGGEPDMVSLHVERPLRLKLGQLALEQMATFTSEVSDLFVRPGDSHGPTHTATAGDEEPTLREGASPGMQIHLDVSKWVERVEVNTSQLMVVMETSNVTSCAAMTASVEGVSLEADLCGNPTDLTPSASGHLRVEDVVVKTGYDKTWRPLIGPFCVNAEACFTWVPVSPDNFMPQLFLEVETSLVLLKVGQEHVFCLTDFLSALSRSLQELFPRGSSSSSRRKTASEGEGHSSKEGPATPRSTVDPDFVVDRTHDDLRCGGFQYIEESEDSSVQPEPYQIMFSALGSGAGGEGSMRWCYPQPRVITGLQLTPVPFDLCSSTMSLDGSCSGPTTVPCVLQYWDEMTFTFVDSAEFSLSESESVTVAMPEPRPSSRAQLVAARVWRLVLLHGQHGGDVAVLPASLAACTCVDSAFIPSLVPAVRLSVCVGGVEVQLANHTKYNSQAEGSDSRGMYKPGPDTADEQVFLVYKGKQLVAHVSQLTGPQAKLSLKVCVESSVQVLEFRHLSMEEVVAPCQMSLTAELLTNGKNQEVSAYVKADKVKVRVGKSVVHTLNMASMAWTMFSPSAPGPGLIFSHYVICNSTTSALRFGQAGTDENILLKSREMFAYSWRTHTAPQLLHLCVDQPSWKWTEPFAVDQVGSSVRSVRARDQRYGVIVLVKKLSALQMKVTICGQVLVSNRLSQPVTLKLCHAPSSTPLSFSPPVSAPSITTGSIDVSTSSFSSSAQGKHYTVAAGTTLPSLVSSDVLDHPIQFRLAGFSTSWSHDIFVSGDRMKENQMVKIPLPDGSSYFHVWCRIFCQHFHGTAQKLVMLTPLYVVRPHLPRPLYIRLDSPKAGHRQEMSVSSRGREFQLHCAGGDVTHQMSFRLGSDMQLSSPAVVLSTGLIDQLERSPVTRPDIQAMCEMVQDTAHRGWPYLLEPGHAGDSNLDLSAHDQICHGPGSDSSDYSDGAAAKGAVLEPDDLDPQPSIDLNVRLSEYLPGCGTLLVEVAPACLLHNATDLTLKVAAAPVEQSLTLNPGQTLAPPLGKEFQLSVGDESGEAQSKTIQMSEEPMDYKRYNEDIGRILFMDGYVHVSFVWPAGGDTGARVTFVTVTSDFQHGIRVVCVRERFALTNQSGMTLTCKLLALPLGCRRVSLCEETAVTNVVQGRDSDPSDESSDPGQRSKGQEPLPLFGWATVNEVGGQAGVKSEGNEDSLDPTFVCYIAFAVHRERESSPMYQWSTPVRLVSTKDCVRATTSIPDLRLDPELPAAGAPPPNLDKGCVSATRALCVTCQQVSGVTHVLLSEDKSPVCVVENLCPFALQFGQSSEQVRGQDCTVQEQQELVSDLPCVAPGGWSHYTPPAINASYTSTETAVVPKLHFRAVRDKLGDTNKPGVTEWSSPVQVGGNTDAFLRLPDLCDLKVMIEPVGMVTHLVVRPVSKAEVTAKEIRSRLTDQQSSTSAGHTERSDAKRVVGSHPPSPRRESQVQNSSTSQESTPHSKLGSGAVVGEKMSSTPSAPSPSRHSDGKDASTSQSSAFTPAVRFSERDRVRRKNSEESNSRVKVTVGVVCSWFTVSLEDESKQGVLSELMCVHLHDLFACSFPVSRGPECSRREVSYALSAGRVQVDNQLYGVGQYDFPVVLVPQGAGGRGGGGENNNNNNNNSNDNSGGGGGGGGRSSSLVSSSSFLSSCMEEGMSVVELHAVLRSRSFLHLQVVTLFDPTWNQSSVEMLDVSLQPLSLYIDDAFVYRVLEELEGFTPTRQTMTSSSSPTPNSPPGALHRSVPPVVAVNSYVFSRPVRIRQFTIQPIRVLLSVHASLKLFLASDHTPLSLAKFERVAVYSTTQRLVHALTMHYASAAIFRAVMKPARLFSERRSHGGGTRRPPISPILWDFIPSAFLSSRTGAVAGIADQPLQTLISSGERSERPSTASSAASGLVTGVGKGLVGVFTKPIGGAAELLSQTGQDTGKIVSSLPSSSILLSARAVTFDPAGAEVKVELLLTPEVVVVVSLEEDATQQTLALSELECGRGLSSGGGAGGVVLTWQDQFYCSTVMENQNANKERVAAFIDSTVNLTSQPLTGHDLPEPRESDQTIPEMRPEETVPVKNSSEETRQRSNSQSERLQRTNSQSESSRQESSTQWASLPECEFHMDPHLEELFLTLFTLAKNKLQGRGFPV